MKINVTYYQVKLCWDLCRSYGVTVQANPMSPMTKLIMPGWEKESLDWAEDAIKKVLRLIKSKFTVRKPGLNFELLPDLTTDEQRDVWVGRIGIDDIDDPQNPVTVRDGLYCLCVYGMHPDSPGKQAALVEEENIMPLLKKINRIPDALKEIGRANVKNPSKRPARRPEDDKDEDEAPSPVTNGEAKVEAKA